MSCVSAKINQKIWINLQQNVQITAKENDFPADICKDVSRISLDISLKLGQGNICKMGRNHSSPIDSTKGYMATISPHHASLLWFP